MKVAPPLALLAELTHRCPLRCAYCYNPVELEKQNREMDTAAWRQVMDEAVDIGVLQVHFSGGEPMVRKDLTELVAYGAKLGLYTNLITAGVLIDKDNIARLADAGLEHVQLAFQDCDAECADWLSGYQGGHAKKLAAAKMITDAGLALTINAIIHRRNAERLGDIIDMSTALGARRLEIANVQYYGWGLKNRAALMPSQKQLDHMNKVVDAARERLLGVMVFDYVVPDYYAREPKACMGGWGRQFINVNPAGVVLPCHAAETISGMTFEKVGEKDLSDIWLHSSSFSKFRGTDWMEEPCQSCDKKEIDWGGCRCQALALSGDAGATDPTCEKSPHHAKILAMAEEESVASGDDRLVYRRFTL
jgi:PqqA peptide cyclase